MHAKICVKILKVISQKLIKSFETAQCSQLMWKGVPQGQRGYKEHPVSCCLLGLVGQIEQ